jgi:hypothetical protein
MASAEEEQDGKAGLCLGGKGYYKEGQPQKHSFRYRT